MDKIDRARQFMPFDALKGFKEKIKEKERIVISKKELSEDDAENLNYKLKQLKVGIMVEITYLDNNEYILIKGMVSKIEMEEKYLKIVKTKIMLANIINIKGESIIDLY